MKINLTLLKPYSDAVGEGELEFDFGGGNVEKLLEELSGEYPSLKGELYSDSGELTDYLVIMVNDKPLSALDDMATELKDGDELLFFFPVAGG